MATKLETTNLVKQYFNICNAALASNRYSAVYGTLLTLINELASGDTITLKVMGGDREGSRFFSTRFIDGEFTPIMEVEEAVETRFVIDCGFLETVVENSDEFVQNPEKLDWSWLRKSD